MPLREPALLLAMQTLRLVVESRQLHVDASQGASSPSSAASAAAAAAAALDGGASQAPASSSATTTTPTPRLARRRRCRVRGVAFDFRRHARLVAAVDRPPVGAHRALPRARGDARSARARVGGAGRAPAAPRRARGRVPAARARRRPRARGWSDKPPPVRLVKGLFEVQAGYCADPSELLALWASERLPELQESATPPRTTCARARTSCSTSARSLQGLGAGLASASSSASSPTRRASCRCRRPRRGRRARRPRAPPAAAPLGGGGRRTRGARRGRRCARRTRATRSARRRRPAARAPAHPRRGGRPARALDEGRRDQGAQQDGHRASVRFIQLINKRGLPMMSCHFKALSQEVMPFLKSLQPATRLLQVHCSMVKARQQHRRAQPRRRLKRALARVKLVFQRQGDAPAPTARREGAAGWAPQVGPARQRDGEPDGGAAPSSTRGRARRAASALRPRITRWGQVRGG